MTNRERLDQITAQLPDLVARATRPTVVKSLEERDRIQRETPPLLQLAALTAELRLVVRNILEGAE
jgi:hypothetical protein